jgi:hypothetical protein
MGTEARIVNLALGELEVDVNSPGGTYLWDVKKTEAFG